MKRIRKTAFLAGKGDFTKRPGRKKRTKKKRCGYLGKPSSQPGEREKSVSSCVKKMKHKIR